MAVAITEIRLDDNGIYPLQLRPVYKEVIWGGRSLEQLFARTLPGPCIGESWELCTHEHGTSIVANGCWENLSLTEVIARQPAAILGKAYQNQNRLPLLIKYIDANDHLSIQVHPGEAEALTAEGEAGKSEAWYIVKADDDAEIVFGLAEGTTRETFQQAIRAGGVERLLRRVKVRTGDMVFVPAGTVHALLKGLVVCEIQQNSDTTYRIYDYDRVDSQGQKRPLHLERALSVIKFDQQPAVEFSHSALYCPYFSVEKWDVKGGREDRPGGRFAAYCVLQGQGRVSGNGVTVELRAGATVLLPAALPAVHLEGDLTLLRVQ